MSDQILYRMFTRSRSVGSRGSGLRRFAVCAAAAHCVLGAADAASVAQVPLVRSQSEGAPIPPAEHCRKWFADRAAQSFAAHPRESIASSFTVADIEPTRAEVKVELSDEWRATLRPLTQDRAATVRATRGMIERTAQSDAREARIMRLSLGRQLIEIGALEDAQAILLDALPARSYIAAVDERPSGAIEVRTEQSAAPRPERLDIEVLRAMAATYRRTDRDRCAHYLRETIEAYKLALPAHQSRSGRGVWNAAKVCANVLAELGRPADAVVVLQWAYRDTRLEHSSEEENALLRMIAGYERDAGKADEAVATRCWLVVNAPEWIWSSTETSSIPLVTLQDALASKILSEPEYVRLIDSLVECNEVRSEPRAFAHIAQECMRHCANPTPRLLQHAEDAARMLLARRAPEAHHEKQRQELALRVVLSELAHVYWKQVRSGDAERTPDLQRIRELWKAHFPNDVLITD